MITGVIGNSVKEYFETKKVDGDISEVLVDLARFANKSIYQFGSMKNYWMSMFFIGIDLKSLKGYYGNAGHPFVYRVTDYKLKVLASGGTILGSEPDIDLRTVPFQLEENDMLMLYTDGLFENMSRSGIPFKYQNLKRIARVAEDPKSLVSNICAVTDELWKDNAQEDDVSILALQFNRV